MLYCCISKIAIRKIGHPKSVKEFMDVIIRKLFRTFNVPPSVPSTYCGTVHVGHTSCVP